MKCTAYVCTVIDHINSVYMNAYNYHICPAKMCEDMLLHSWRSSVLIYTAHVYKLNWHALISHWQCERSMSSLVDSGHFCDIKKKFAQIIPKKYYVFV